MTSDAAERQNEPRESLWARFLGRREAAGPQPVSPGSLVLPTIISLAAVFGNGRTETHDPGGLPATLMLWIAGPALFVSIRQKVCNGGKALAAGAGAGLAACLAFAVLFGSERVSVDFAGIVLGVFVFDVVYWLVSKRP